MGKCKAHSFIKISLVSLTQGDNNRVTVNYFMIKETFVNMFEVQSLHQLMFITIKYKKKYFFINVTRLGKIIFKQKREKISSAYFLERCKKI